MRIRFRHAAFQAAVAILLAAVGMASTHAAVVNFQRTVVVSPPGPAPANNGLALLSAVAGVAAQVPPPSADNPWLIKVEPGVYDVGATAVSLPPHVDLEGSGTGATAIVGAVDNASPGEQAVVAAGEGSEVRWLSVTNTLDADGDSAALLLLPGSRALGVHAFATGGFDLNRAVLVTFKVGGTSSEPAVLNGVAATAQTRAMGVFFPGMDAHDVDAGGQQGLLVSSGAVRLRNSRIQGEDFSLLVTNLSPATDVLASELDGPVDCSSANCVCVNSYNGDYDSLRRDCSVQPGKKPF